MYYSLNQGMGRSHKLGRVLLLLIGLLLGAAVGMYVAALTLPLPHDYTPVYIFKH